MAEGVPDAYWTALMNFAQRVGADDPVNRQPPKAMDEKDRKWLQEAMSAWVNETDPTKQLKRHLEALAAMGGRMDEIGEEAVRRHLEAVEDLVQDVYVACDLFKLHGLRILTPFLHSTNPTFRQLTAAIIAASAQNNPYAQQALLDAHLLPVLMEILVKTDEEPEVRRSVLTAISCSVRGFPDALTAFYDEKRFGPDYLCKAFDRNNGKDVKLSDKLAFFVAQLTREQERRQETLGLLVHILKELGPANAHESALERIMVALAEVPHQLKDNFGDDADLKSTLQRLEKFFSKEDAEPETRENIRKIMHSLSMQ